MPKHFISKPIPVSLNSSTVSKLLSCYLKPKIGKPVASVRVSTPNALLYNGRKSMRMNNNPITVGFNHFEFFFLSS